jgi:probable phosphoglycerate mutase
LLILHADGGCVPNPGNATCAVVADRDGKQCFATTEALGYGTNNIAEWRGAIAALTFALSQSDKDIELRMDSRLVVEQFNGKWRVKDKGLKPLAEVAKLIARAIEARGARLTVEWISREHNTRADALTQARVTRHAA